ncbi:MAG: ATP-binding cassette domain-containing protein [Candidatus Eisenbacteria bacterium]|nr:ATP-binding cassette domain-containing protein [Candidatus Eisenbacteria bacterium]
MPVAAEALLEVADLSKDYGPVRAVDRVSFTVHRGEIVGLLGPNGAGKSTAMRVLVGYQVPSGGAVHLAGGEVFREGARVKRSLGYLPENMPLYPEMRVDEYLAMVGRLKRLDARALPAALTRVRTMLDLEAMWRRPCGQLSRGYRQRVGLAQCLIADPPLLVLDEPTSGLDPNQIAELRRLLEHWRAQKGILLSTHILAEALLLCDRVLILSRGRLVASGSPKAFAGRDAAAPVATVVTIRGGRGRPLESFRGAEEPLTERQEGDGGLWRIEGRLARAGRLALMAYLAERGWDVVEWNAGLSALEEMFRRVTLESAPPGED